MVRDQGVVEIWYGELADQKPQIDLVTDAVARTAASGPYTGGKRLYGYVKSDLMWVGEKADPRGRAAPVHVGAPEEGRHPGGGRALGQGPPATCRTTASPSSSRPAAADRAARRARCRRLHWRRGEHRLEERPAAARLPADAAAPARPRSRRHPGARDPRRHPRRGAQDRVRGQHLHRLPDPGAAGGARAGQPRPSRARRADVPPRRPAPPHPPGLPGLHERHRGGRRRSPPTSPPSCARPSASRPT